MNGYIRYANDNIDISEETLDGTGTFNASQTVAFRRKEQDELHNHMPIKHGQARAIKVPDDFKQILPSPVNQQKPSPVFPAEVTFDMYHRHERITKMPVAKDIA